MRFHFSCNPTNKSILLKLNKGIIATLYPIIKIYIFLILSKITEMPRKKYFQEKIIKNINQYKRTEDCMEIEETSGDKSLYDPVEEGGGTNSLIKMIFWLY